MPKKTIKKVLKRKPKRKSSNSVDRAEQVRKQKDKSSPTQKGIRFKKKYNVVGENSVDPESGVSKQITEQVGTRGEKVSTGAGTRARSFPQEQSTKRSRKFRKKVAQLETKVEKGTATKKEIEEYTRIVKQDAKDVTRAASSAAKTRVAGRRKQIDKKFESDAENAYVNDGEILKHPITKEDYNPPAYIQRRAERNAEARAKRPRQRQLEALKESKKTGGQIKGYSRSRARPKGVGAAQRGWGATGRH